MVHGSWKIWSINVSLEAGWERCGCAMGKPSPLATTLRSHVFLRLSNNGEGIAKLPSKGSDTTKLHDHRDAEPSQRGLSGRRMVMVIPIKGAFLSEQGRIGIGSRGKIGPCSSGHGPEGTTGSCCSIFFSHTSTIHLEIRKQVFSLHVNVTDRVA